MKPFSQTAIQAHCKRAAREGGERIVRTWTKYPGYLVEAVHFAGEPCLRFTPTGADYTGCNVVVWQDDGEAIVIEGPGSWPAQVCVPRAIMSRYLTVKGGAEEEAFLDAAHWINLMGKEVSQAEIIKVVNVLVETWPDFFAVPHDVLLIEDGRMAHVAVADQNGNVLREGMV